MIIDQLHSCISERQKRPAHFRVLYPSLRFHKERVVRLHGLLMFSVNLLVLHLTPLYRQQEWLVMCTAFPLFKFNRNEVLCFVKRLYHFIFTSNYKVYAYIYIYVYIYIYIYIYRQTQLCIRWYDIYCM
jgi:hypothetical protein